VSFTGCVADNGTADCGFWLSPTLKTSSDGEEAQISYLANTDGFTAYAESDVSGMKDGDVYLNVDLKATAEIPARVEIVYGQSGESAAVFSEIRIGTEYERYSFRTGNSLSGKSVSKVRIYPSYNALSGYGIVFVKNLTYTDYYETKFYDVKSVSDDDQNGGENEPNVPVQVDYLHEKYAGYFKMGMCAGYNDYGNYGDLEAHYNSFTCENEMKLYVIGQTEGRYDYDKADRMIRYMVDRGKQIRGHTLIWYNGAPSWLTDCRDKTQLLNKIDTYCYNVVKHFKDTFGGSVYCWDVVNEAISDSGGAYRDTFYGVAGIDYIKTAFRAARRADPNVKLFYNDYNMDDRVKRNAVIEMLRELIRDGVPIDGVGMQGHYGTYTQANNVEMAIAAFENLAEETNHPLEIHITELDVKNYENSDSELERIYGELFEVFRRHADSITSVTTWGVSDEHSWLNEVGKGNAHPFLFDENHNKKPAFQAVFDF
ncbi:MAG: endo-1,4-beta-xylanase, partial [Candidatus Gallimonas sp.]